MYFLTKMFFAMCCMLSIAQASTDEAVTLPKSVLGQYLGTVVWGKNMNSPKISSQTTATVTQNGNLVTIHFSGGKPGIDQETPNLANFQFKMRNGTKTGKFESIKTATSQQGVSISSFLSNMNIENLYVNGVRVEFTGAKITK